MSDHEERVQNEALRIAAKALTPVYSSFIIIAHTTDENLKGGVDMDFLGHVHTVLGLLKVAGIRIEEVERKNFRILMQGEGEEGTPTC